MSVLQVVLRYMIDGGRLADGLHRIAPLNLICSFDDRELYNALSIFGRCLHKFPE